MIEIHVPDAHLNPEVLKELNLPKILQEEMLNVRTRIATDAARGIKADSGGIKPYSASYKRQIDSGSVFGKEPGNHTPNLYATGVLMRSMTIENLANGARMFFSGSHPAKRKVSAKHAKTKRKRAIESGSLKPKEAVKAVRAKRAGTALRALYGQGSRKSATKRQDDLNALYGIGKRKLTRSDRGLGATSNPTNAQIAAFQNAMGRDGWFALAHVRDRIRIVDRVRAALADAVKKLVVTK